MNRAFAAVALPLRFVLALLLSGLHTARVILRAGGSRAASAAGFVRVPVAPLTPRGSVVLACLVSLTPGTSVIEIDTATHSLVLHMLDLGDADSTVRTIRRDFEPALRAWFASPR